MILVEETDFRKIDFKLAGQYHFKAARDVTAEHPRLQSLDVSAHVSLRVQDMTVVCELIEHLLLLVRENDIDVESLDHQQRLAQRPGTFTQHLRQKAKR